MNISRNYKTHNVDVIETVINTILVHSLTSLWQVHSSVSFARTCKRRCLVWLSSHSSFLSSYTVSTTLAYILKLNVFFITTLRLSKKHHAYYKVLCQVPNVYSSWVFIQIQCRWWFAQMTLRLISLKGLYW